MKIRIDLKIIAFLIIFLFTGQLKIYFIIMTFCFLHELGHICVARILKMKVNKIEILPCGFSSSFCYKTVYKDSISAKIETPVAEIIVAITGPIISLMLAIIFQYINAIKIPDMLRQEIVYSNILILIFNLLPLYPLDGGRILKNILYMMVGSVKSERIINRISYITIISLTIISSIAVYYFKNIAIFLACIFLWTIIFKDNLRQKIKLNSI